MNRKIEWELYEIDDFKKSNTQKMSESLEGEFDEEDEELVILKEELENAQTVYDTPMGIINKDDSMHPIRRIEHWIMQTNFSLDEPTVAYINYFPGIETLKIVTRYQAIIGFGKLFDRPTVKRELTDKLLNFDSIDKNEIAAALIVLNKKSLGR